MLTASKHEAVLAVRLYNDPGRERALEGFTPLDWSGGVLLAVIAGAGLIIYVAAEMVNWAHTTVRLHTR